MWASAVDAFAVLKEEGLLAPYTLPERIAQSIPEKIGPYPIHDVDGNYLGFALSGYGIMWNKLYLQAHKLEAPSEWTDLIDSSYHGHLSMSAPSRSGTTHLTVESILQTYGWKKGWEIVLNMGGNMASITERSFGVPQGVINGEFGIGVVIDFFGLSAIASGFPVDFVYPSVTPIVPANIGLIKDGPNPENAREFINFLLSEEGQLLLFDPKVRRLPVIPELYAKAPEGFPDPFKMEVSGSGFDIDLSQKRYGLINSLFDQVVTFRLKALKGAWRAIYKTEAAIEKQKSSGKEVGGDAVKLLNEARALVSAVPISEEKASDPDFNENFSKKTTRAEYETEWDAKSKANYAKAKKLAVQAMDAVK